MKRLLIEIGLGVLLALEGVWLFQSRMAAHDSAKAAAAQKASDDQKVQALAAKAAAQASYAEAAKAKADAALAKAAVARAQAKAEDLKSQVASLKGDMGPVEDASHQQLVALVEKQDEEITALTNQVGVLTVKSAADEKVIANFSASADHWHASSDHFEQALAMEQLSKDATVSSAKHQQWNLGFKVAGVSVVTTAAIVEILDHRKR